jgi:hypothetical protein
VATNMSQAIPGCSNPRARSQLFEQPEQPRKNTFKNNKVICSNFPGCSTQLARLLTCSCKKIEQAGKVAEISHYGLAKGCYRKAKGRDI